MKEHVQDIKCLKQEKGFMAHQRMAHHSMGDSLNTLAYYRFWEIP